MQSTRIDETQRSLARSSEFESLLSSAALTLGLRLSLGPSQSHLSALLLRHPSIHSPPFVRSFVLPAVFIARSHDAARQDDACITRWRPPHNSQPSPCVAARSPTCSSTARHPHSSSLVVAIICIASPDALEAVVKHHHVFMTGNSAAFYQEGSACKSRSSIFL